VVKRDQPRNPATIQVLYFGLIRNVVDSAEDTITLPPGATVRDLFDSLGKRHGRSFSDALFTAHGTLLNNAIVLLDGSNILSAQGLETEINGRSSAHIMLTTTAVGGG
jgi:molybdopterin converting factor small subunit